MSTIIAKNNTASAIELEDLGVTLAGSGQRTLSDTFEFTDICVSVDLKGFIQDSSITINNGTADLSIADAIEFLDCKNAGSGGSGSSTLAGLSDVDLTGVADKFALVFDEASGIWKAGERNLDAETTDPPAKEDTLWLPPDQEGIYTYNSQVGDWVSASSNIYMFSRDNKRDGAYLGIANHDGYYYIHRKGYITHIHCKANKGTNNKAFQIHVNGSSVHDFSLVSSLYEKDDLSIQVNQGDILKIWVMPAGGSVEETTCQVVINWSHEVS